MILNIEHIILHLLKISLFCDIDESQSYDAKKMKIFQEWKKSMNVIPIAIICRSILMILNEFKCNREIFHHNRRALRSFLYDEKKTTYHLIIVQLVLFVPSFTIDASHNITLNSGWWSPYVCDWWCYWSSKSEGVKKTIRPDP